MYIHLHMFCTLHSARISDIMLEKLILELKVRCLSATTEYVKCNTYSEYFFLYLQLTQLEVQNFETKMTSFLE